MSFLELGEEASDLCEPGFLRSDLVRCMGEHPLRKGVHGQHEQENTFWLCLSQTHEV